MRRLRFVSAAAAATFLLAGCAAGSDTVSESADSTDAANSASGSATDSPANGSASESNTSESAAASEKRKPFFTMDGDEGGQSNDAAPQGPSAAPAGGGAAVPSQYKGQVGGKCGSAEGWTIEAKDNTSCEFAYAIYGVATQQTYNPVAPDPTVTPVPTASGLSVTSPANGQTYTLECFVATDARSINCSGKTPGVGISARKGASAGSDWPGSMVVNWD